MPFGVVIKNHALAGDIERRELINDRNFVVGANDFDDQVVARSPPPQEFEIFEHDTGRKSERVDLGFGVGIRIFVYRVNLEDQPDAALVQNRVVTISASENIEVFTGSTRKEIVAGSAI